MNEQTLEPPELGPSLDLSNLDGPGDDEVHVTWATAEGRRVVVKSAQGSHRSRLRREAEVLSRVAGPDVVDLLAVQDQEERTSLVLADAGHRTLADPAQLGTDALLRALARTGEAVARLHELGWSHGRLEAQHVIVGARGRVQLCSLSAARPIGSAADTADDLSALLGLGEAVAEELDRRGRHDARTARRLRSLLTELDAAPELDARRAADALGALRRAPTRRRVVPPLIGGSRRRQPRVGSSPTGVTSRAMRAAAVSIVLAGAGTLAAVAFPGDGSADPVVESLEEDRPSDGEERRTQAVQATAAPAVVLDERTYRVGRPGDRVAVGDWDCDGTATVRLLRPSTGELFEFGPPDPTGAPTTAQPRSVHAWAVDLIAGPRPGSNGCHLSVLRGPDGRRQEIP